jgi:hypothetical protein
MTWVAWRQYRLELIMGLALLAALATFVVPTGIEKLALFRDSGLAACLATAGGDCSDLGRRFLDSYRPTLHAIVNWLNFLPAIVGVLLAAPIVMEFEQRTYRLAWTQSVTRGRWLAAKLGLALLAATVFAVAMSALMAWWYAPQLKMEHPFIQSFNLTGAMPLAYTVSTLAFALTVGVLARRTIPAMVVTLVAYFAARLFVGDVLRPAYLPPLEATTPLSSLLEAATATGQLVPTGLERAWIVGGGAIDHAGNPVTDAQLNELCSSVAKEESQACLDSYGLMENFLYHPPDRFWTFQAIEAAIFLGAAAILLAVTVWVVSSRMR